MPVEHRWSPRKSIELDVSLLVVPAVLLTLVCGTLLGYALVLDEEGREMHKSWGNAIEFNDAADTMGVDVMRWMYCTHKPEQNLYFGYKAADETRRRFLIPLWNVYSFFVTYANTDGWTPERVGVKPSNQLDRWILSEL